MKKRSSTTRIFGLTELDLWHHAVLVFMLTAAFFAYLFYSDSKTMQFIIGGFTAILYVGWGAVHHYWDGDLHYKNMIEYILIALLGMVILTGVLV